MNRNQIATRIGFVGALIAAIAGGILSPGSDVVESAFRGGRFGGLGFLVSFGISRFVLNFIPLPSDPKPAPGSDVAQAAPADQDRRFWIGVMFGSAGAMVLGYFMFQVSVSLGSFVFLIGLFALGYALNKGFGKK
jgi:hypothetical protein